MNFMYQNDTSWIHNVKFMKFKYCRLSVTKIFTNVIRPTQKDRYIENRQTDKRNDGQAKTS